MEELDIKQMESIIKNKLLSGSEESYKSYEMLVNHLGKDKQSAKIGVLSFRYAYSTERGEVSH